MSEPMWTPAPWIAEQRATGTGRDAGCAVIASDEGLRISNPSRGIVAFASRTVARTNAETEANARLIAAAPNIYWALERILRMPINGVPLRDWEDNNVTAALDALAKARGEA